jgi:hypothetical protein
MTHSVESRTKADWKYRPVARAVAIAVLTGIVVGIERTLQRWLSPNLAWGICAVLWVLGTSAMFSFFERLSGESKTS